MYRQVQPCHPIAMGQALSEAKDLSQLAVRSFASLRMTFCYRWTLLGFSPGQADKSAPTFCGAVVSAINRPLRFVGRRWA